MTKYISSNGNRTEWSPIRSVIIRVLITSMITDPIGWQEVYYQLIMKITISERRIAKLWKKGKIRIKMHVVAKEL